MVLVSPKLGFHPESELPFVVDFQLPLTLNYSESKGRLHPQQILPSEVAAFRGFTSCLISMTKGVPGAAWRDLYKEL